ncbi:hypothetical protein [Streptomyces boninensis]|uniref:hypothetical protein n=1 Tax=Streptomyces boninensis TaxID=2039455 RepID=UPI003B22133F
MTWHPYIHELTHAARTADLQAEADVWARAARPRPATPAHDRARVRIGWLLVETGLRLVRTRTPATAP